MYLVFIVILFLENQGNLQKQSFKKINRCQTTSPVSMPVYHLPGLDSRIVTPNVPSHNKDNDNYVYLQY